MAVNARSLNRATHVARGLAWTSVLGLVWLVPLAARADEPAPGEAPPGASSSEAYETLTIRGKFVWLAEALERRYGVTTVPEARDRIMALETRDGQLVALAEDIRGRAFRNDERLRQLKDCELLVRRYHGSPVVQVIRLYSHEPSGKVELDYYCEICAIALFELKPCDCCQGPIELRRRPVRATEAP